MIAVRRLNDATQRVLAAVPPDAARADERDRVILRHVSLGLLVAGTGAALQAPAITVALTYMLATATLVGPFLPNAAAEIRSQARHGAVYVAVTVIPFRALITVINSASPEQLQQWFGSDLAGLAANLGGGILPTIYFITVASVPLAWTGWLARQWSLHRRSDDWETQLLRARRTDRYQH